MNPAEAFTDMTSGPWWMDVSALAAVLVALATIWRMVIWPGLATIWAAIKAAPKIPVILDEIGDILKSDVLGKLDEIKTELAVHEVQNQARDERLDSHTLQLEDHGLRLGKLERDMAALKNDGSPEGVH